MRVVFGRNRATSTGRPVIEKDTGVARMLAVRG
jgi:hypothetical protein